MRSGFDRLTICHGCHVDIVRISTGLLCKKAVYRIGFRDVRKQGCHDLKQGLAQPCGAVPHMRMQNLAAVSLNYKRYPPRQLRVFIQISSTNRCTIQAGHISDGFTFLSSTHFL